MGARGHRIVGPGERAEDRHRCEDQRTDHHSEHRRGEGLKERQAENDRKGPEHRGGQRVRATPGDAQKIKDARIAVGVRYRLDAVGFEIAAHPVSSIPS
jgi:hypothetical protein